MAETDVDIGDDTQIPTPHGDSDTLSKDMGHQDEDDQEEDPDIEDFDD